MHNYNLECSYTEMNNIKSERHSIYLLQPPLLLTKTLNLPANALQAVRISLPYLT